MIQHVIHQLTRSPIFSVSVIRLVKQQTKIAVVKETKFHHQNVKQKPDEHQYTPLPPLTGCSKNSSKTSKDDKKNSNKKKISSNSLETTPYRKCNSTEERPEGYEVDRHKRNSMKLEYGSQLTPIPPRQ